MHGPAGPRRTAADGGVVLRCVAEGAGIPALVIGSSRYYPRTFSRGLRGSLRFGFMDLRHFSGAGAAHRAVEVSLDTYADDIDAARVSLGFERMVLIGHSHHGNLALEYARRHPSRVSHLVLIGSPPCNVERTRAAGARYWQEFASAHRKAVLRHNWSVLGEEVLRAMSPEQAFVARYVADGPKYWYDPGYDASALWRDVAIDLDLVTAFRSFFTEYELCWDAALLQTPALVVMGRHDYVVPHVLWEDFLPPLRNVTFRLFEHSGHTPQLEQPGLFDRVLLEWLAASR
jgi:proline iminopeptidase